MLALKVGDQNGLALIDFDLSVTTKATIDTHSFELTLRKT
jgi:hypothetical protein